jgi:hypothetical protein
MPSDAISAFRILSTYICFRAFTCLSQISRLICLRLSFFYTIIKTQYCIIYPKLECVKPYKQFLVSCPNNRFYCSLGVWVFLRKNFFRVSTQARSLNTGLIASITAAGKNVYVHMQPLNRHCSWIYTSLTIDVNSRTVPANTMLGFFIC